MGASGRGRWGFCPRDDGAGGGGRGPLARVVVAILAQGFGLSAVVPLFPLYGERFGLASGDFTLVFAVYAASLVPTLLVVGPRSDVVGRRPVLLPALACTAAGSVVFAAAQGLAWLVVARMLQGVANGAFWGAASAWVRDLVPDERREDASLVVSTAFPASVAVGALTAGGLASLTGSPAVPWVVHVVIVAVAAWVVSGAPETVAVGRREPAGADEAAAEPGGGRFVRLPAGHGPAFLSFVAPVTFALIAVGATVMALTPVAIEEVGSGSAAVLSGVGVAALIAVSAVVQPLVRGWTAWRSTAWGVVVTVVGAAAVAGAVAAGSAALLLGSLLVLGVGNGFTFKGTLALAERMAGPGERAGVISAYNVAMYTGFSLPSLAAGYATEGFGLAPTLGVLTAASAVVVGVAYALGGRLVGPDLRRPVAAVAGRE